MAFQSADLLARCVVVDGPFNDHQVVKERSIGVKAGLFQPPQGSGDALRTADNTPRPRLPCAPGMMKRSPAKRRPETPSRPAGRKWQAGANAKSAVSCRRLTRQLACGHRTTHRILLPLQGRENCLADTDSAADNTTSYFVDAVY